MVKQDGLKLNGRHQLLVYADDVTISEGSVHTIKENAETLIVASKEIGLEVNDQNAGRSQNMRIDNRSFERVEEFKYLGKL